jgi:hypothetical protein
MCFREFQDHLESKEALENLDPREKLELKVNK